MNLNKKQRGLKSLASGQIFLLVCSLFAISFLIGNVNLVSGQEEQTLPLPSGTDSVRYVDSSYDGSSAVSGGAAIGGSYYLENAFNLESIDLAYTSGGEAIGPPTGTSQLVADSAMYAHALLNAAIYIAAMYAVGMIIGDWFDFSDYNTEVLSEALSVATAVSIVELLATGEISISGLTSFGGASFGAILTNPLFWIVVGVWLIFGWENDKVYLYSTSCLPYEAPLGGESCEECNGDPNRPCTEYRCRSLGQACELVNAGTTNEKCSPIEDDGAPPFIKPWEDVLTEGHSYISEGSLGTRIVRDGASDGCLAPYTNLEFGVALEDGDEEPELAQCKLDNIHTDSFENMISYIGSPSSPDNSFDYTHNQILPLPTTNPLGSDPDDEIPIEFQNNGEYDYYVRCIDVNGNENSAEFVFSFCVDPSPDTTSPQIEGFSIESGSYVAFGTDQFEISVFVDEPAECRWSVDDKSYESMEHTTENGDVVCGIQAPTGNSHISYPCVTTLTGIEDMQENKFYFRCRDQPNSPENERFTTPASTELIIRGSQELNIISYSPTDGETVTGNSNEVDVNFEVETSNGAEEGNAICSIKNSLSTGSYIVMFETNNFEHHQVLQPGAGDHTYDIRCVDAGGNLAEAQTSFSVFVDQNQPQVTSAYHDVDALKLVTSENADCSYSLNSCNFPFDEGLEMSHVNTERRRDHYAPWEPNVVYYIKCRDDFGNQPSPNACSLIASATSLD
jgi:hypothetical protein